MSNRSPIQDILLVEDNPGDARLIKELLIDELGRDAFTLRIAETLADAVALIGERLPHVVVLDLSLPDSFGLTTLYKIESASPALPVVVLTGNEDSEMALAAVKAGAQDFLVKNDLSARLLTKTIQYARERKHNEESLRTSEARFRSLAELSSDWYWEQDANAAITYVSEGILESSGIPRDALEGRSWRAIPHADAATPWDRLDALLASRRAFQDFVVRCSPGGGESFYVSISGVPVVELGSFTGYRGLGKDVTARERAAEELRGSEELFRKIMDTGRDGIVMLDGEGRITFLNRRAAVLFGQPEDELRGRDLAGFLADAPGDAADTAEVLSIRQPDGRRIFAMQARYPLLSPQREFGGTLVMLTNLLEHREREERVRQLSASAAARSEADRASTAKSRFLATVSHDLRQPMHALGLFIGDLKTAELPGRAQTVVGHMEAALQSTQSLLDAILIFSRLESGMVAPNLMAFPIEPMLNRVRAAFKGLAREKDLRFAVASSEAVVRSDPALLERICFNLVSNALRYTREGGVILTCRDRPGALLLQVWDTGVGIAPDQHEAVFREFYRVPGSEERQQGGVGLGLAIVRSCSVLIGSPVDLHSTPGRGSRFSLRVPLGELSDDHAHAHAEEADARDHDGGFDGVRVILVDDDPLVLEGTRTLLQRWGCEVLTASSGPEAEALLDRWNSDPALVISDLRLDAGELGTDVVARLRRRYRASLPALLVSGDTSLQTAREVRRHGIPLLYKPVPPGRLRAAMAGLLHL